MSPIHTAVDDPLALSRLLHARHRGGLEGLLISHDLQGLARSCHGTWREGFMRRRSPTGRSAVPGGVCRPVQRFAIRRTAMP
jgi:hypothetical protein